jgi:hypothetical protein
VVCQLLGIAKSVDDFQNDPQKFLKNFLIGLFETASMFTLIDEQVHAASCQSFAENCDLFVQ